MPIADPFIPRSRSQEDIDLLRAWKNATGFQKEQAASKLLHQLHGAIMTAVNAYRGAPLPQPVVELEAKRQALDACKIYQEGSPMGLAGFVTTTVKNRLARYVLQHQNVARLPENVAKNIGPLQRAEVDLRSRYGREPTADEVADHTGMSMKQVTRARTQMHRDLLESGFDEIEGFQHDKNFERAMMAYYSMSTEEKLVFDHSLGAHGKQKLKPAEIAREMKVSPGRVSQIKKQVAEKIKPWLT